VWLSGGITKPDPRPTLPFVRIERALARAEVSLYALYFERSSLGQAREKPSPTQSEDDSLGRWGVENLTSSVNGTLINATGTIEAHLERVARELSGSYLLGIEVSPSDRDGRPHKVDVRLNRGGVDVRARREYVIEPALERNLRNPAPGSPSMGPAVPATATGSARRTASPAGHVIRVITPDVEAVLTRAAEYVAAFEAELSGLVAEERYRQRSFTLQRTTIVTGSVARSPRSSTRDTTSAEGADWVPDLSRDLRSDFLLVKAPGSASWQPFRDVYEVDGKKTRDREARLHRLFIETPTSAVSRAAEITAEAARYNIGFVARNINVPTLALLVLTEDRRRGFAFWKVAETTIDGTRTWEIAYAEQRSPTLVRTVAGDMPAAGSFWIDPVQGRVVRSQLRLAPEGGTIEITVAYRPDEKAGRTWVPAEMHEVYASGKLRLECGATAETYRIDSNPAVRVSSSSSNTVRRSRTTRSWSMRPMIGGSS